MAQLRGEAVDLAVVFASPHHAGAAQELLDHLHELVAPASLLGCVAEAVVGGAREVEETPGLSVWLAAFPGEVETFHMSFVRTAAGGAFGGWRFEPADPAAPVPVHIMVCDPLTFPADLLLQHLNQTLPGALVVGGMASGGRAPGSTILFQDRHVRRDGAVGARLGGGVTVRTLVSQGCRPIGQPYVVTQADQNIVMGLAGKAPMDRLREAVASMDPSERQLVSRGLHLGRVIDEYKLEHGRGDFLIRGVMGADPETGAIAVGDQIDVGETVRFHVRDAATADEELESLLERSVSGRPGELAGALLFTCNGRGTRLFPTPHHDAEMVSRYLGGAPLAGFFCAGELGPVGGKNFMHGFTASLAMFVDAPAS